MSANDKHWNDSIMVRLMRLIHAGEEGTRHHFAELVGTSPRNLEAYLPLLHKNGLVRVVRWERSSTGAAFVGVYGWGDGKKNAPRQTKSMKGIKGVEVAQSDEAKRYMLYLQRGNRTALEMAEITGATTSWTRKVLESLRRQGFSHVAEWERDGAHPPIAVYAPGRGVDAPRPKPLTQKQSNRRRWNRLVERFGEEAARRIITPRSQGGPERIVQDGKTVWVRGVPRGSRA